MGKGYHDHSEPRLQFFLAFVPFLPLPGMEFPGRFLGDGFLRWGRGLSLGLTPVGRAITFAITVLDPAELFPAAITVFLMPPVFEKTHEAASLILPSCQLEGRVVLQLCVLLKLGEIFLNPEKFTLQLVGIMRPPPLQWNIEWLDKKYESYIQDFLNVG